MKVNSKTVGIIIPCFNESNSLNDSFEDLYKNLIKLNNKNILINLILVNDGSTDNTWDLIKKIILNKKYKVSIKGINLFRNFGKDNAIFKMLKTYDFDAYLVIDSDGEHPFSEIKNFISCWNTQSYPIVMGVRANNGTIFNNIKSFIYYLSIKFIAGIDIEKNITDFKLIDSSIKKIIFNRYRNPKFWKLITEGLKFEKKIIKFKYKKNQNKINSSFSIFTLLKVYATHLFGISTKPFKVLLVTNIFLVLLSLIFSFLNIHNLSLILIFLAFLFFTSFIIIIKKFEFDNFLYHDDVLLSEVISND